MKEQKCYHMTPDLKAIMNDEDKALKPKIGKSSERVNDIKNLGLSYSLGLEGVIVTNAFFKARYQYELLENEEDKEISLDDMFEQDVKQQEDENLNSRVYLSFDETEEIRKENAKRDISDSKTKSSVSLDKVKGVVVKNTKTGEIKHDRESIVRYAISKTNINDILSKIKKTDRPFMNIEGYAKTEFSFKQYIERYYEEMLKDSRMLDYTNGEYELEEIELEKLLEMIEMDKAKEVSEGKSGIDDASSIKMETKELTNLLSQIQNKYNELLLEQNPEVIKNALNILKENKEKVHLYNDKNVKIDINKLDPETRIIFELMEQYRQEIKELFINREESIIHIRNIAPENIRNGKITPSKNRANNYEEESGDWVFASSTPLDGKNAYMARKQGEGMILLNKDTYVYGGDNFKVIESENGNKRVILKEPNYAYILNPENFTPVVTLKEHENRKMGFEFSEEWVSEQEIDINNSEQVRSVEEISDITELINNYQVLCDVKHTGEARKIRNSGSIEKAIQVAKEEIKTGRLRYINGETGINVNKLLIEKSQSLGIELTIDSIEKLIDTNNRRRENKQVELTSAEVKKVAQNEKVAREKQGVKEIVMGLLNRFMNRDKDKKIDE